MVCGAAGNGPLLCSTNFISGLCKIRRYRFLADILRLPASGNTGPTLPFAPDCQVKSGRSLQ